jgi:plasmid stabilization system protein ParE
MNRPVIFKRLARAEFDEAADWYESQKPDLGFQFTAAVRSTVEEIGARPRSHPQIHNDVREALVPRFPFALYFRIDPTQITILAVFHTSRDPVEWQRRV